MLGSYRRAGADYQISPSEYIQFDGIYMTASVSTTEVMLACVEEFVASSEGQDRRKLVGTHTE